MILLIPTPTESSSAPSILDFLVRSVGPGKLNKNGHHKKHQTADSEIEETKHFIESKTAPYQVDISQTSQRISADENLVANSPAITVVKNPAESSAFLGKLKQLTRKSKAIIFTVKV